MEEKYSGHTLPRLDVVSRSHVLYDVAGIILTVSPIKKAMVQLS